MNERLAVTVRAALLGGGVAALMVCALAAINALWNGRLGTALFFAFPWLLTLVFVVAPRSAGRGGR